MNPIRPTLEGLHHVTAITADAQNNINFYAGVLGLRLVKLTVNFDDPGSYHLYYGDELGRPGTVMTFFAWPGAYRGHIGPPQVTTTAFAVPSSAIEFWRARLAEHGIKPAAGSERFGQPVINFVDPDGMQLEIIGNKEPRGTPWTGGTIPQELAIRGFDSITISEGGYESTARLLTEVMGFKAGESDQDRFRYHAGAGDGFAATVDLVCLPAARVGTMGAGVVHHVAFRTADDAGQLAWRGKIVDAGFNVSPVMDRTYFHSIYYREPGGVLFEIATENPGFTADQPAEELGRKLMLPPWLEKHRTQIERIVPKVRLPGSESPPKRGPDCSESDCALTPAFSGCPKASVGRGRSWKNTKGRSMRAVLIRQFGDVKNLRVEEIPTPEPAGDEVLVEVQSASINPSDVKNVTGVMHGTTLPRVPGRDFAGVVARGPADLIGKEVWGTGGDVGFTRDGSHAQYILLPRDGVALRPAGLTADAAGSAGVTFVTAWQALVTSAGISSADRVLIIGAAGGVGSAAVQIARLHGAGDWRGAG